MSKTCLQCGADVAGEQPGVPCPKCGCINRAIGVSDVATVGAKENLSLKRFQGWPQLLDIARQMLDAGHYGLTVILAQTACEVVAEHVMSDSYPVRDNTDYVPPFSLAGKRRLKEYKDLTGDKIDQTWFWPEYLPFAMLRHECVHRGLEPGQAPTVRGLCVANEFVKHVAQHNNL